MPSPSETPGTPSSDNGAPPPFDLSLLPKDDLGPGIRAGVWILVALSGVFLGLRVYCKQRRHSRLFWDDTILIAAWVSHLMTFPNFCSLSNQIALLDCVLG